MRLALIFCAALSSLLLADRASACATCAVGDPTLNVMGVEQPYAGRTRIAAEVRHFSETSGTAYADRLESSEQQFNLALSHSPTQWLTVAFRVPLIVRSLTYANLANETIVGPGDATLRARFVLYRDRDFAPSQLIWTHVGLEVPTAPVRIGPGGDLPLERQLGTGSWDPSFALGGSYFAAPFSVHGAVLLFTPTRGAADTRVGSHVRSSLFAQYQPWTALGFRLGIDARFEAPTMEGEREDTNSGGIVGYTSFGLIASPASWLTSWLTITVPVIEELNGNQDEGVQALLGVTIDA